MAYGYYRLKVLHLKLKMEAEKIKLWKENIEKELSFKVSNLDVELFLILINCSDSEAQRIRQNHRKPAIFQSRSTSNYFIIKTLNDPCKV